MAETFLLLNGNLYVLFSVVSYCLSIGLYSPYLSILTVTYGGEDSCRPAQNHPP